MITVKLISFSTLLYKKFQASNKSGILHLNAGISKLSNRKLKFI